MCFFCHIYYNMFFATSTLTWDLHKPSKVQDFLALYCTMVAVTSWSSWEKPWNASIAYRDVLSHDDKFSIMDGHVSYQFTYGLTNWTMCSNNIISIQDGAWHKLNVRNVQAHNHFSGCTWLSSNNVFRGMSSENWPRQTISLHQNQLFQSQEHVRLGTFEACSWAQASVANTRASKNGADMCKLAL